MSAGSALLTDLYQLTMLQAYFDRGMHDEAVFELFVRRLPEERNFLVAAGLEQALQFLESLRFTDDDIAFLAEARLFSADFLHWLKGFRFTGTVDAMPEGTVFFADEPILRVVAPLPEAQLVESRLLNLLHFQTLVASKAARCVLAAGGRQLVDFGMRRAHGAEAALLAARASYLAGFDGTATVIAKSRFDIPIFGTMAHSFIQSHDGELEAFEHFARSFPGPLVLLIDTYDTEQGARRVVELARRLPKRKIHSVRLDSGDLGLLAGRVRQILDDADLGEIRIFASGGIEELAIERLVAGGAPIDGFGVGTSLDVSEDCPALDCVYKIQEYAGRPRRKRSTGKATWPGRKQVYRRQGSNGQFEGDCIGLVTDERPGRSLLHTVMRNGAPVGPTTSLAAARAHARDELGQLPAALRALDRRGAYDVELTESLRKLATQLDTELH